MFKQLKKRLSIKSQLMLMLLGVSLGSVLVVGLLSVDRAKANLRFAIRNQLTGLRATRTHQIESLFQDLRNHIETLSEDRMVVSAMVEFYRGYEEVSNNYIFSEQWNNALQEYYAKEFLPRLAKNVPGELKVESYIPQSQTSKYLQYHYIVKNPYPIGEKHKFTDAGDGSSYSKSHAKYHEIFRNLVDKFGYSDLFLIDPTSGNIVYAVSKNTDFTANLDTGLYRESNLSQVVAAVQKNPERHTVKLVDFQPYRPSWATPVAFAAGPIYNGPHMVGILAIQLPVEKLDAIMTANRNWENEGLGKTGETYLVGADFLMRSNSRFLIENTAADKPASPPSPAPGENIPLFDPLKSSILSQKVNTQAAQKALAGEADTAIVKNYRDITVFSSYTPLRIPDLNWAIIAEKNLSETDAPIIALQTYLVMVVVIIIVIVTWLANVAASLFLQPVNKLLAALRRVQKGELNVKLQQESNDEFGELTDTFNATIVSVQQLSEALDRKNREHDALLLNILPSSVVEAFKKGEQQIVKSVKLATVLFAHIRGFTEISARTDAKEVAALLNELVKEFDSATEKHDVTKVKTIGDRYLATCGVEKPRLDHTQRIVDFALEMFGILQLFNSEHQTNLGLSIGIDDGEVIGALIGTKNFAYDYWGETVSVAELLQFHAEFNTIMVTPEVYECLRDVYKFERGKNIDFPELGKSLETWVLKLKSARLSSPNPSDGQDTVKIDAADITATQV